MYSGLTGHYVIDYVHKAAEEHGTLTVYSVQWVPGTVRIDYVHRAAKEHGTLTVYNVTY